jgi:hypothetical protein
MRRLLHIKSDGIDRSTDLHVRQPDLTFFLTDFVLVGMRAADLVADWVYRIVELISHRYCRPKNCTGIFL